MRVHTNKDSAHSRFRSRMFPGVNKLFVKLIIIINNSLIYTFRIRPIIYIMVSYRRPCLCPPSGYRQRLVQLHHRIRKLRAESAAPQMTFFFRSTHPYRHRHANYVAIDVVAITRARNYLCTIGSAASSAQGRLQRLS